MQKDEEKPDEGVACESAESRMTQNEYIENLDSHQRIVQTKSAVLTQLSERLKNVRESKIPLAQIKNSLQEEINHSNRAINTVSEEATLLKQKLRYHSVRQINDNIERLQYQLRNNNYKPREEQKILDEISMLQRSIRTLREYEAKQAENRKYRAERSRLIDERNDNFSRIRDLYRQEDVIKKEISVVRDEITTNKRAMDQLRQLRPRLEVVWAEERQRTQAARMRRYEEKRRLRMDQIRERNEEKQRLWEEYEASQEAYEEEKTLCRVLIAYLQSSFVNPSPYTPSTPSSTHSTPCTSTDPPILALHLTPSATPSAASTPATTPCVSASPVSFSLHQTPATTPISTPSAPTTPSATPTSTPCVSTSPSIFILPSSNSPSHTSTGNQNTASTGHPSTSSYHSTATNQTPPSSGHPSSSSSTLMHPPEASGCYYSKPKTEDEAFTRVSKRKKAKSRREQRLAGKVKELPHTPDVLSKFAKLSIHPPKNTDEIPSAVLSLQDRLQHFHTLSVGEARSKTDVCDGEDKRKGVCEKREGKNEDMKCVRPQSLPVKEGCGKAVAYRGMVAAPVPSIPSAKPPSLEAGLGYPQGAVSTGVAWGEVMYGGETRNDLTKDPVYNGLVNDTPEPINTIPCLVNGSIIACNSNSGKINGPCSANGLSYSNPGARKTNPALDLKPEINKVCTQILTPTNRDSYFSVPMSYANNIPEPNNNNSSSNSSTCNGSSTCNSNSTCNNSTPGFSYAAIAAKTVPNSVEFVD